MATDTGDSAVLALPLIPRRIKGQGQTRLAGDWSNDDAVLVIVGLGVGYLRQQGMVGGQLASERIDPAGCEQSLKDRGGMGAQTPGGVPPQPGAPPGFDPNVVRDGRPMDAALEAAQGGR